MARTVFVALVAALVLALCAGSNGLNIGTYYFDTGAEPIPIDFLVTVSDANLLATANAVRQSVVALNDPSRYAALAAAILQDVPDAFVYQEGLSFYVQSPATVFPVTQLSFDSVAQVLAAVQSGGLSYTIVSENLDIDVTTQAPGAQLDTPDKIRFKVRSGVAVRTSLLPLVITKTSGKYVNQDPSAAASARVSPVYITRGWQRVKFFADATPWIISAVSFSSTSSVSKAQANELLALTTNDQYSIVIGAFQSASDPMQSNAVSVFQLAGFLDAGETVNDLTNTCCEIIGDTADFAALFGDRQDLILYRTPPVRLSYYHVNDDIELFQPYGWPSGDLSVNVFFTPLGLQDGTQAPPVVLPGKPNPPPPPHVYRNSEGSSPVLEVDVAYTRVTQAVNPPSVAGAFSGPEVVVVEPVLPVASSSNEAAYLPGAFVNQVRPLTHSVSADASTTAMSLVLLLSAVLLALAQMF